MGQLEVNGCPPWSELTCKWVGSLQDIVLRHPSRDSVPVMSLIDGPEPTLCLYLKETRDSRDWSVRMARFVISNVKLTYHPGDDLARKWLASAWAGYIQHEALELCTIGGTVERPLCPHTETSPGCYAYDRGLRDGLPVELNHATLIRSLAVVMPLEAAIALANGSA